VPIAELPLPLLLSLLAWIAVGIGMAVGRERGGKRAARSDPHALVGLGVQALAFAVCFNVRRPLEHPDAAELVLRWLGAALAWASAGLAIQSAQTLGRQWSLEARLLPEHTLVREGPYRYVRHPIYSAMLGLLVGTGVNVTAWWALAGASVLYVAGTLLRTGVEERLLRERFGEEYARYAAEVPALLPMPLRSDPAVRR
jgi:protein-S-isoprenylcysteine O-methyltransferase Ste14